MNEKELLDFISSIEGAANVKKENLGGKECITFIYQSIIKVDVPTDVSYALISINYKTKGFSNGKIKDAYVKWISSILDYNANVSSLISVVNVGDSHTFNMFLSEELLNKLPTVLKAFIDNFLPSIQPFVKDNFDMIINSDENEENEGSDNISKKDIYKALSSIGVSGVSEQRDSDGIVFSFTYLNSLQIEISLEFVAPGFTYLTFMVECHPKALSSSKINKKLSQWVYSIVKPYDKSNFGVLCAEASDFGYMVSLTKEMLPALKELLDGFEKDFLPSIKEFLK